MNHLLKLSLPAIILLAAAGCSSSSTTTVLETTGTPETGDSDSLRAMFAGATFVQLDDPTSDSIVEFTTDTVTWIQNDVQTSGTYAQERTGDSTHIASFADRDIAFASDGGNLLWNNIAHQRAATSLFNSQDSLTAYLDGATYYTVEQFDIGENATGEIALGNWSVRFDGDSAVWAVQDMLITGNIEFVNGARFNASFGDGTSIVMLDNNELVINSIVYRREPTVHFASQDELVTYLDGTSYESVDLMPVGESVDGTVALGHWRIDFVDNTFNWFYEDIAEAGTIELVSDNQFNAVLSDRTLRVEADGNSDNLVMDNLRYQRVDDEAVSGE